MLPLDECESAHSGTQWTRPTPTAYDRPPQARTPKQSLRRSNLHYIFVLPRPRPRPSSPCLPCLGSSREASKCRRHARASSKFRCGSTIPASLRPRAFIPCDASSRMPRKLQKYKFADSLTRSHDRHPREGDPASRAGSAGRKLAPMAACMCVVHFSDANALHLRSPRLRPRSRAGSAPLTLWSGATAPILICSGCRIVLSLPSSLGPYVNHTPRVRHGAPGKSAVVT
ncbi:hypothetical protein LXA43DRAFT_120188 [Ganoderma leucocontextum]|nr:hypothetical protein LXA43DRAFT_120188 [Ganoderma leucocontextum]